jgi:hypothetical protein
MKCKRMILAVTQIGVVLSFAGCVNSTMSTSNAVNGDFETAYDAVSNTAPTSDMPTRLEGAYKGRLKMGVNQGPADALGSGINATNAEIFGDLNLAVDWTDGQTGNAITGTASNFTANEAGSTATIGFDGTLSVDASEPATIARVVTPAQTIAGYSVPEIATGSAAWVMTGQLSRDGTTADTRLLFNGQLKGAGASSINGAVVGSLTEAGTAQTGPDVGLGGVFYANKQ